MNTKRIAYTALLVAVILGLFLISETLWIKHEDKIAAEQAQQEQEEAAKAAAVAQESLENKLKSGNYNNENLKVVFLTFDDGPFDTTDDILDMLKENDVKATFFTNGKTFYDFTPEYNRYVTDGHTLANHTYSHEYYMYDSPEALLAEIEQQRQFLLDITGTEPSKVFRFPGGSHTANQEDIDAVSEAGYNYVDWNVITGDGLSDDVTADEAFTALIDGVHKNSVSVVLCHAENPAKEAELEGISNAIKQLKSEGYTFLPIKEDYVLPRFVQPTDSTLQTIEEPVL